MSERNYEERFEERLEGLKEKYDAINDFDFVTILKLEDEYNAVSQGNSEHTRRRNEILDMRKRLVDRLNIKNKEDIYIATCRKVNGDYDFAIYYKGRIYIIRHDEYSYSEMTDKLISILNLKDKNIFIDRNGMCLGLADELDARDIKYNELNIREM